MRTGIFISHAHEDRELAQSVRRLLEEALKPVDITCTSDEGYGLTAGDELAGEIRRRIDTAKALFLLATPAAAQRSWVNYECAFADAAHQKGEMQFYILVPTASHLSAVPGPYSGRVAVTLSRGASVHTFVGQLRQTFSVAPPAAAATTYVDTLLDLERRCVTLETERVKAEHAVEIERVRADHTGEIERVKAEHANERRLLEAKINQRTAQRNWILAGASACVLLLVIAGGWWTQSQIEIQSDAKINAIMEQSARDLRAVKDQSNKDLEEVRDRLSKELAESRRAAATELKTLPFSGLLYYTDLTPLRCTQVVATVFEGKQPRMILQNCHSGTGTFTIPGEVLNADPLSAIYLTVKNGNEEISKDHYLVRSQWPVAIAIPKGQK